MAFSEDNQNWVREEINKAIYPNGSRKIANFLRYWGLLAVCIGAFISVIAMAVSLGIYVANTMGRESEFRGTTSQQLKTIEQRLSGLESTLNFLRAQTVAQKYSAIPVVELKKHQSELATARQTLSRIPPDTPNFWPASFQIITLLSQAQATRVVETVGLKPVETVDNGHFLRIPGIITLAVHDKNILLKNSISGVEFYDSVIHFDPSVKLTNVAFVNCVFIFPLEENPPKSLQQIGTTLLASDLSRVTLNAS